MAGSNHYSRKGFSIENKEVASQIRKLRNPSAWQSIRAFAEEWGLIVVTGIAVMTILYEVSPFVAAFLYLPASLFIATRQSALKNLVHEGLHFNLARNRVLNDVLAVAFGAFFLCQNIDQDRKEHCSGHHAHFWDEHLDSDVQGYFEKGFDTFPVSSYRNLIKLILATYPLYVKSALRSIFIPLGSSRRCRVQFATYWIALFIVSLSPTLFVFVMAFWVVPFIFAAPLIRFFVESTLHASFECTGNEFTSSRNNLGWFNEKLIHPRGDGYHLTHHLYPYVPFFNLEKAHILLLNEAAYRKSGRHVYHFFPRVMEGSSVGDLVTRHST